MAEAIRRHKEGYIITLMWHAVRPTEDEPVTFHDSIQGKLSAKEWDELVTDGTPLNTRWKTQVDVIARLLKQLQAAQVPVLWRPYHEMNGAWFWWGQKPGENGYKRLYRMLFDRLVHHHGLNNLIWVYNCNEASPGVDPYAAHYPGDDVVDILATDVYRRGFAQDDYDSLKALAGEKPIALGEVGEPPPLEIFKTQPNWAWFMVWGEPQPFPKGPRPLPANMERITEYSSDQILTLEELPWVKDKKPAGQ